MHVRLTQLDGKLPNLALMRLSAFHKARGDDVHFTRSPLRQMDEPEYGAVYGSAIFTKTAADAETLQREFPGAVVGGTGTTSPVTVESIVGDFVGLDYEPWPDFTASLGFTQRGCRFKCGFCVVPEKEGRPQIAASIADIWRGEPWPKHLHLLDNDFFGQPKPAWKARMAEIREGGFAVCFNQGINIRVITPEGAEELASVDYRSARFVNGKGEPERRIYTAWDSLGDERLFLNGVDRLEHAGIRPSRLMVYMLIGYDPEETWAAVFRRFNLMIARRVTPYIMVFGNDRRTLPLGGHNEAVGHQRLTDFERWVNGGLYRRAVSFADYEVSARWDPLAKFQADLFGVTNGPSQPSPGE